MSLKTLINIAGMPGMDLAVSAAVDMAQAVQNIKVYRAQCKDLSDRCTKLLIAFREKSEGLEGTEFMAAADEVSHIVERAHKKALSWASWNRIKSLVNQGDIRQGLEQLYRDIDLCAQHFNISSSAELHRGQRELQLIHERDVAENREILQTILLSVDGLRDVINEPSAVRPIMQTIQEELQQQSVQPEQLRDLQQGLYEIHRKTQYLPPMIDLTGQVQKTSRHPLAFGAYNDVYTGLWLGEEKVALKFARAINHTAKARKRFHKEVEIWRDLQHPHVSRLYGIFYIEDQIYSVSPWMDHGSALDYINSTDEVINRVVMLGDVASGMEYLHRRNVVHGDLRAANVLIGEDGKACVSDFGLSQVIEEVAPEMSSSTHGDSPVRWQAPELVKPDDYGGIGVVSPSTDVWSYGMLCIEIMTGKKPYHYRPRDANVIADLVSRRLPDRPMEEAVIERGMSEKMWNLMLHCWNWEPLERPPMTLVKVNVRSLQTVIVPPSPIPLINKSLTESPKPMPKDLSPETSQSQPIPFNRRASLSPGVPFKSPSLSSTPPKSFSPPSLSTSPPRTGGLTDTTPGSAFFRARSSVGSFSSIAPLATGSYPGNRHRPSISSTSEQSTQDLMNSPPPSAGALGLFTRRTSESSSPGPESNVSPADTMRQKRSFSRQGNSSGSSFDTPMRLDLPSPSGLSLTNPSYKPTDDLLNAPPRVKVEQSDDEAIFENFIRSENISLKHASTSYISTMLQSQSPRSVEHSGSEPSVGSVSSSFPSSFDVPFPNGRTSSLSDLVPPRSPLLDIGSLDLSIDIHYKKDGSVKAGTLAGLINRLLATTKDGYANDKRFRDTFLTTYRLFTSTEDVLKLLLYRFTIANADQKLHMEERVATRHMVLTILRELLKGHYAKALELHHLEELRIFLKDITSPLIFANTAQDLVSTIDDLMSRHVDRVQSPTPSRTASRNSVRASEISPTGLAIALTVLEGGNYKAISPSDCVSYLLYKDGPPELANANKVAEARAINNKIVNWVKKSMLRSDTMENRGDTLRFFVNTASECRKLHNYSSMSALVVGIESQAIARLKLTRGCLDKTTKESSKKLAALLDIGHNHQPYRKALPDSSKTACLPYLAVHLKDLQSAYERPSDRVTINGSPLINFEKFTVVYDSILATLAYQERASSNSNVDVERKPGPLLYLEDQLATTVLGQAAEAKLEARSLELQKKEDLDYENRVNELAAVGFRTSRGRS